MWYICMERQRNVIYCMRFRYGYNQGKLGFNQTDAAERI